MTGSPPIAPKPAMSEIERRIVATVSSAKRDGLDPKSLYLTPEDRAQLRDALGKEPVEVGGLAIRAVGGRGKSRLYCRHGVSRPVSSNPAGWRR